MPSNMKTYSISPLSSLFPVLFARTLPLNPFDSPVQVSGNRYIKVGLHLASGASIATLSTDDKTAFLPRKVLSDHCVGAGEGRIAAGYVGTGGGSVIYHNALTGQSAFNIR